MSDHYRKRLRAFQRAREDLRDARVAVEQIADAKLRQLLAQLRRRLARTGLTRRSATRQRGL